MNETKITEPKFEKNYEERMNKYVEDHLHKIGLDAVDFEEKILNKLLDNLII